MAQAADLGRELNVPQERFDELRQIAVTALAMPDMVPRYLGQEPKHTTLNDISDDTTRAIFRELDTQQHVIRAVSDRAELCRLPPSEVETQAFFSPDGRFILRYQGGQPDGPVELWNIVGSKPVVIRRDHRAISRHQFRSDSRVLALAATDASLMVWDVPTGAEDSSLAVDGHHARSGGCPAPDRAARSPVAPISPHRVLLRDYHTGQVVQKSTRRGRGARPRWPGTQTGDDFSSPQGRQTKCRNTGFDQATRSLEADRVAARPVGYGGIHVSINSRAIDRRHRDWSVAPAFWTWRLDGRSICLPGAEPASELSIRCGRTIFRRNHRTFPEAIPLTVS